MNILKRKRKSKENVTYKQVKFSDIGSKRAQVSYCYQIVINKKSKRNKPTKENILRKNTAENEKFILFNFYMDDVELVVRHLNVVQVGQAVVQQHQHLQLLVVE